MDLKIQWKALELIKKMSGRETDIHVIDYTPQKKCFPFEGEYCQPFPRSAPEEQGISSAYLSRFFKETEAEKDTFVHSLMILRHGHVIAEGSFSPYQTEVWHVTHSLCKSITALAVGMAVGEGILSLDEKVRDIFKDKAGSLFNIKRKSLTIEHLLRMSSGVSFGEIGGVSSNNWIKDFMESGRKFEPGTRFAYNSMNSYMLSAAIREKTGQGLMEFLEVRLWQPLGITKVFWERSPEGIEKGGWGLYLCPEDMAKVGQLCLQNGKWNGKQLVSSEWIKCCTEKKTEDIGDLGRYGYGYHMWMGKRDGSYQFNGMLGQNVLVFPDLDMVLVTTGGSRDIFQESKLTDLIEKWFCGNDFVPDKALPADNAACHELRLTTKNLSYDRQELPSGRRKGGWPMTAKRPAWKEKTERQTALAACIRRAAYSRYALEDTRAGFFPMFSQCIHNNYTHGIREIGFGWKEQTLTLIMEEGEDHHEIPIGFDKEAYGIIGLNQEEYLIATKGKFFVDEDGVQGLKLITAFIELANVRIIKFRFFGDSILLKWDETPGFSLISDGINAAMKGLSETPVVNTVFGRFDAESIGTHVRSAVEPEIRGKRIL